MLLPGNLETTYDTEADALYIYVQPKGTKAVGTMQLSDAMLADLDSNGNLAGIEILFYAKRFDEAVEKNKKE